MQAAQAKLKKYTDKYNAALLVKQSADAKVTEAYSSLTTIKNTAVETNAKYKA